MKTGYDQHFKKVKQTVKPEALNIKVAKGVQKKNKKNSIFPVSSIFGFLLIVGSGLLFLENFDSVEDYLKNVELSISSAQAADEVKSKPKAALIVEDPNDLVKKVVPVDAKKADDADYLFKLAERKQQLDQREADLNKLAEHLEKQKSELSEKLVKLDEMRDKISKTLQERIKADDAKVDTLVQMYSNMKPAQAAKIFETLDEDLVIEVLGRMKKKNAADILNLIKTEKAQVLAERYTGYRAPAATGSK